MQVIKGESGYTERVALASDVIMLAVFLWNQIRYGQNMLYLIIPLTLIGLYLCFFCVIPEEYRFDENSIKICHKLRRTVEIPYTAIFNYEAAKRDSFINIGNSNKVKLYYQVDEKKKAVICRPRDVETFVNLVKINCPEFYEDSDNNTRIKIFFDNNN